MPHLRHFVSETMNLIADHSKVLAVLINLQRLKLFFIMNQMQVETNFEGSSPEAHNAR